MHRESVSPPLWDSQLGADGRFSRFRDTAARERRWVLIVELEACSVGLVSHHLHYVPPLWQWWWLLLGGMFVLLPPPPLTFSLRGGGGGQASINDTLLLQGTLRLVSAVS